MSGTLDQSVRCRIVKCPDEAEETKRAPGRSGRLGAVPERWSSLRGPGNEKGRRPNSGSTLWREEGGVSEAFAFHPRIDGIPSDGSRGGSREGGSREGRAAENEMTAGQPGQGARIPAHRQRLTVRRRGHV